MQEAFDQPLGGEGLASAFLAENGDVGVKRGVGDAMRPGAGGSHEKLRVRLLS